MAKMLRILVFLLVAGTLLGPAAAEDPPKGGSKMMRMEGGTVIDDMRYFAETVNIKKKVANSNESNGETKCMGVIFSSPVIFTSMLCEITDADKGMWSIEPIKTTNIIPIAKVTGGRYKADFKKIDLALPGLELTEKNTGDMAMAAPFNQNPDDDMESVGVVFAFGDHVKACTVKILMDEQGECQTLYKGVIKEHPNLALPPELHPHLYCAVKGEEKMNITMMHLENMSEMMEIDVGMPCDDSLGAPVHAEGMVLGIVVGAFCGANKLVLIQPSINGLSLESYTEKVLENSDDGYDDGSMSFTEPGGHPGGKKSDHKNRADKPIPANVDNPEQKSPKGSATTIFSHIRICTIIISALLLF